MTPEPVYDLAHLGHMELLTPKPDASLKFFVDVMGMTVSGQKGESVYLRGWDDYERYSLKLTGSKTSGMEHMALRARSPQALERRVAALKGSEEIGFTIVSITLSLIAVFIPLFLTGGYIGKLFQEFAITVSVSLVLSLIISLTLTPMMCARLLKTEAKQHGWLYRFFERGFDGLLNAYEHGLKIALHHRLVTLMIMLGTIAVTGYLYYVIPKGFFPQQDTGLIIGIAEAAQDISYDAMVQREGAIINTVLKDPAVDSVGASIGAGGGTTTLNQGRVFIALKPRDQRHANADQIIKRLQTELAAVPGITLYMQAAQDITVGGRLSKTQYQYTLADADSNELNHWSAYFLDKLKSVPGITDVTTDQEHGGPRLNVTVNREVASSFGILPATVDNTLDDAFGQRIVSTMYTALNQYHVVLEVDPRFQTSPDSLNNIYVSSSAGQEVPLSALTNSSITAAPIVINGSEKTRPARQKSYGRLQMCRGLRAGMTTMMIHPAATTPASVGVNNPVRMPPSRITGIIKGSAASRVARAIIPNEARGRLCPIGPKK